MAIPNTHSPFPSWLDRRVKLRLTGGWPDKGIVEFYVDGQYIDRVRLPHAQWVLLVVLVRAAKRASGRRWANAFLTADKLAGELRSHSRLAEPDKGKVAKIIYELRQSLGRTASWKLVSGTARGLGGRLVEYDPNLRYRISAGADQLELNLSDAL